MQSIVLAVASTVIAHRRANFFAFSYHGNFRVTLAEITLRLYLYTDERVIVFDSMSSTGLELLTLYLSLIRLNLKL